MAWKLTKACLGLGGFTRISDGRGMDNGGVFKGATAYPGRPNPLLVVRA